MAAHCWTAVPASMSAVTNKLFTHSSHYCRVLHQWGMQSGTHSQTTFHTTAVDCECKRYDKNCGVCHQQSYLTHTHSDTHTHTHTYIHTHTHTTHFVLLDLVSQVTGLYSESSPLGTFAIVVSDLPHRPHLHQAVQREATRLYSLGTPTVNQECTNMKVLFLYILKGRPTSFSFLVMWLDLSISSTVPVAAILNSG